MMLLRDHDSNVLCLRVPSIFADMVSTCSFICSRRQNLLTSSHPRLVFAKRLHTGNNKNRRTRSAFGVTKSCTSKRSSQPTSKTWLIRRSGAFPSFLGGVNVPPILVLRAHWAGLDSQVDPY